MHTRIVVYFHIFQLWLTLAEKYLTNKGVDWKKAERTCFNEWSNPDDDELGLQIVRVSSYTVGCLFLQKFWPRQLHVGAEMPLELQITILKSKFFSSTNGLAHSCQNFRSALHKVKFSKLFLLAQIENPKPPDPPDSKDTQFINFES